MASMIISGLSPVATAYATSELIKSFEQSLVNSIPFDNAKIIFWISIIVFSVAINLFTTNIKNSVSEFAGYKLSHNVEDMISSKFQNISQKDMDTPAFLDLYKNTVEQANYAPLGILDSLFNTISTGIGLIGYLVILLQLNIWLVFLIIIFTIPIYYMKYNIQVKRFDFLKKQTHRYREVQYYFSLISDKRFANEVRLFNIFAFLKVKRSKLFSGLMNEFKSIVNSSINYTYIITALAICIMGILEFLLVRGVITETLSLSKFILYNTAIISLEIGMLTFIEKIVDNNKSMLFLDYLFDFLNYKTDIRKVTHYLKDVNNDYIIEFDNVSFKYPDAHQFSLRNVNLKLTMGEKICLVGENGSGKTTLIKLLLGIYEPTEGKIYLNNIDIKNYDLKEYQKLFGTTFQEFIHYFFDVRSNIAFGNIKKFDDTDYIKKVAEKTNSKKFIENYTNKYETKLSKEFYDEGVEPSVGQWQKLAVSRTVFRDAPILILDEPTASLDPRAEEEIFKIFNEFGKEKIVLIISHRMCSARLSDRIILLDKGEILESGTHTDLMQKKGQYFELYTLQAEKYFDYNDNKTTCKFLEIE